MKKTDASAMTRMPVRRSSIAKDAISRRAVPNGPLEGSHCLLIAGMHRSGTSAATRIANFLGADMASNLIPANEHNVSGYWEQADIVKIHDEMLQSAGSGWEDWRPINQEWFRSPTAASFARRIGESLLKDFEGRPLFVIKDPRISRFLPLWKQELSHQGAMSYCLIMVRHPLEVAESLKKRNNIAINRATLSWLNYMLDAELYSRDRPRHFMIYKNLVNDWRGAFNTATLHLGLSLPRWASGSEILADRFIQRGLYHHHVEERQGVEDQINPWALRLYNALVTLSREPNDAAAIAEIDHVRAAFQDAACALGGPMTALEIDLGSSNKMLSDIRLQLSTVTSRAEGAEGAAAQANQAKAEIQRQLEASQARIVALEAKVTSVEQSLQDKIKDADELQRSLVAATADVAALMSQLDIQQQRSATDLGTVQQALHATTEQVAELSGQVDDLQRHSAESEEQVRSLNKDLALAKGEVEAADRRIAAQASELRALQNEVAHLRDARQIAEDLATAAHVAADAVQGRLRDAESANAALEPKVAALTVQLATANAELEAVRNALAAQQAINGTLVNDLAVYEQALVQARRDQDSVITEREKVERELERARNDLLAANNTIDHLKQSLLLGEATQSSLRGELASAIGRSVELAQVLDATIVAQRAGFEREAEAEARALKLTLSEREAQAKIHQLCTESEAAKAELVELQGEVKRLSSILLDKEDALRTTEGALDHAQTALDTLRDKYADITEHLSVAKGQITNLTALLEATRLDQTLLEQKTAASQDENATLQAMLSESRRAQADAERRNEELAADYFAVERKLISLRARTEAMNAADQRLEEALAQRGRMLVASRKMQAAADERIRSLEAACRQQAGQAAGLAETIVDLKDALARSVATVSGMSTLIDTGAQERLFATAMDQLAGSPLFDAPYYAAQIGIEFESPTLALAHYLSVGWRDFANPNYLFDSRWYLNSNPGFAEAGLPPLVQFLFQDMRHPSDPHPLFDMRWYLSQYPDIAASGVNPLEHYLRHGIEEGRLPNPLFIVDWYVRHYPDSAANPLQHYIIYGAPANVSPCSLFDSQWYRHQGDAETVSRLTPLGHYLGIGRSKGWLPGPLFRADWYKANYADLADQQLDPYVHYVQSGADEKRRPNPYLDPAWYCEFYPDIKAANVEPIGHYLNHGWLERRNPSPDFNTGWYLDSNPDVVEAQINPLMHFLCNGEAEGRQPLPTQGAAGIPLDPKEGISAPLFDQWRLHRLSSWKAGLGKKAQAVGRFAILVLARDADEIAMMETLDSIRSIGGVEPVLLFVNDGVSVPDASWLQVSTDASHLAELLRALPDNGHVLVIQAGDRIDMVAADALRLAAGQDPRLTLFDLTTESAGRHRPLLLPGVDAIHADHCDYFRSRFLVAIEPCVAWLATGADGAVRSLALAELSSQEDGRCLHIPVPLVVVPADAADLEQERAAIVSPVASDRPVAVVIRAPTADAPTLRMVKAVVSATPHINELVLITETGTGAGIQEALAGLLGPISLRVRELRSCTNRAIAFNMGIAETSSEIVACVDSATFLRDQGGLAALIPHLTYPDIAVAGPLILDAGADLSSAGCTLDPGGLLVRAFQGFRWLDDQYLFYLDAPRKVAAVDGSVVVLRRAVFEDLNGFDEQLGHRDWMVDFCFRAGMAGWSAVIDPRVIAICEEGAGQAPDAQQIMIEAGFATARWTAQGGTDRHVNPALGFGGGSQLLLR